MIETPQGRERIRQNTIRLLVDQHGVNEHDIQSEPLARLKWMLNARRYENEQVRHEG